MADFEFDNAVFEHGDDYEDDAGDDNVLSIVLQNYVDGAGVGTETTGTRVSQLLQ